jgi:hypothetical protein
MKRLVCCCSALALVALHSASVAAQSKLTGLIGFGTNIATTDYKDADSAKTGYQIMAGLEHPFFVNSLAFRVDGNVGWNARNTIFRESTYLAGINLHLVWSTPQLAVLHPYLIGGVGYLYNKYNPGQTGHIGHSSAESVLSGGVGTTFTVGPAAAFVEGRYDRGQDLTRIYPIILGVRFSSSSSK